MPSQIKNNIIAFDETLVNVKNGTKEVAFLPKDEAHHQQQQQRHQIIKSKEGLSPITSKKPFFADEIRPIATLTPPTPPTASTSTPSTASTASTASSSTSTSSSSSSSSSSTTTLQKYQQQSKPIVTSFQPKVYNPHPLLTNEHLQTILGVFIRDEPECAYIPTTNTATATATANLNQKHQPTSTSNNTNNSNYNKNDDDTTIATKATKIIQTMRELFPIAKAVISKLPTILGLEDKDTPSPESTCMYWDKRERIDTPDGDFFHVDYKFANINNDDDDDDESDSTISNIYTGGTDTTGSNSKGMVVIVHGLESNSNSTVCINMARSFHSHDFDVACMNFRGCSGVPNDTIYQYHGGFTDDLKVLIQHLSSSSSSDTSNTSLQKKQPMYISGFSLGANIVMKCLGELSTNAVSDHNIRGAAVTAAPFHLRPHHRRLIDEPIQRTLYAGSILKSMKSKIDNLVETYCDGNYDTDKFDYWMVKNATTIAEVEDGMIAPLYGFKDKFDYFEQSSSIAVVDDIAVPTFVLNAADDPFFSTTFFPWDKDCEVGDGVAPVKLVRTAHGGHLGHLFHQVDSEEYYDNEPPVASFALSELGRFINHVHTRTFTTNR
jgi:predicted alpha/beta-fold hydrolase